MELKNLIISLGETITSNELYRDRFSTLVNFMTNNVHIKNRTDVIRSIEDKHFRNEKKRASLPHFNMGLFKENIRRSENLESIQFMIFEFDDLSESEYELVYNGLLKDERTFMLFKSASGGRRFKVIFYLEKPVTNCFAFANVYKHYFNELKEKYKVEFECNCDVQKGSYISHDEKLYLNPNCTPVPLIQFKPQEAKAAIPNSGEYSDLTHTGEAAAFLKGKITGYDEYIKVGLALASIGEEGRNHFLTVCADNPKYPKDTVEKLSRDFDIFLKSYKEGKSNRIKINSFFYMAIQKGFTFPVKMFSYTEQGGADMLAYYYSHELKYCHQHNAWYIWDGTRWKIDLQEEIRDYIKDLLKKLYGRLQDAPDRSKKTRLLKFIRSLEQRHVQDNILRLAQSHEKIRILADDLDSNKYLFNCLNGTVDLTSNELLFTEHDSSNLITQTANVKIVLEAQCPKWEAFLNKIFLGDEELIEFVQKALGYSLTGLTSEQCLFLMIGNGQNGKSTFIETLQMLMGDYAVKSGFQLVAPQRDGKIRNDIARLKGPRLVVTSEPKEGIKFDESIIKDLTGGDTISARFLFHEEFSFKPMFKLWIYGNHKPVIKETDKGIYRRIKIIPFDYTFNESEKRPQEEIINDFIGEMDGILCWMLEGFCKWKANGLKPAQRVTRATNEYFEEMDFIQNFINDCCLVDSEVKDSLKEVYKYFVIYCKNQGEEELTQRQFSSKLKAKGYDNYRGTGGYTIVKGLRIKTDIKTEFSYDDGARFFNPGVN